MWRQHQGKKSGDTVLNTPAGPINDPLVPESWGGPRDPGHEATMTGTDTRAVSYLPSSVKVCEHFNNRYNHVRGPDWIAILPASKLMLSGFCNDCRLDCLWNGLLSIMKFWIWRAMSLWHARCRQAQGTVRAHVKGQEGSRSAWTKVLVGKTHQQGPQVSNPESGVKVRW